MTRARVKLEIVAPDRRRHADEMIDLISKVFSSRGYYEFRDYCRKGYIVGSHYDWDASRIGLVDGRIVTHYGVWDYRMRVGSARLRVGGVGVVATDSMYRGYGLMARTIDATHDAMREQGYDLAMLFGIRDFYHRYGYCNAWADREFFVDRDRLPQERPRRLPQRFMDLSRRDAGEMHNRESATLTGSAVRPTYGPGRRWDGQWVGWRWTDMRGRLAGYVFVTTRYGVLECCEMAGDVDEGLRVLNLLARRGGWREVKFFSIHHESTLGKWLRRNNSRETVRHWKSGGPMVRIINVPGCLKNLSGEMSRRLRDSHLARWTGKLLIADRRESATLDIRRGVVRATAPAASKHALRGDNEIAQLLIGSEDPDEVVDAGRLRLTGDARMLAHVLFPNRHPNLAAWDRY